MELTAQNVENIILDCLFKTGEDTSLAVKAEGVLAKFGFHPERLAAHKAEIKELLFQLPEPFQRGKGGGWSFLDACMTKDSVQWGEHRDIDRLLVLGIATGQAKILVPRDLWKRMPGRMPYFEVLSG